MGCGASSSKAGESGDLQLVDINKVWAHALQTVDPKGSGMKTKDLVIRRSGWKTVRIFVSSTFKDFHAEREVLVKKVFPDLRLWCESRRIQLIDCDLRWGVPKDSNTEGTLRACLGEIDRCYQDNVMPFFLNMTSERVGWVPLFDDVPESIRDEYKWIQGLSVTEMEIMHGAYRRDNPNALFMLRDPSFLEKVPEGYRKAFVDGAQIAPAKLKVLKEMIQKKFHKKQVKYYKVEYLGQKESSNLPELGGIDGGDFSKAVYEFFKERIEKQYPLEEGKLDPYQAVKEQHESFMKSRSTSVLGRDDILAQVKEYVTGIGIDLPLLLVAGPGTGKSSILTKIADETTNLAMRAEIPGAGSGKSWHVFYHFVGAVPASTELESMLKRLLKEMEVVKDDNDMPSGLENTAMLACSALSNPNTKPTVIIVDALNQFDEELPATQVTWVPRKLAPQIRCIFSMIPDTAPHKSLRSREPVPKIIEVAPLSLESRKLIVQKILGNYNKMLDPEQMECLMEKSSSENPLWLSIACEELRVFGMFREILDKINRMADGLLELEMQVMKRFEEENGGELVVATLCLLEASSRGLLETELLSILADEDNLMPRAKDEGAEKDDSKKESSKKDMGYLPMFKWSEVYRALKPFIRPFGDSGEGRLDFYHRSLSKAVRRKYFKDSQGQNKTEIYRWWHKKLADFFENVKNLSRKLEEYPIQLIHIGDHDRLETFLVDWSVFDQLFDIEYSGALIKYWRIGPGFDRMAEVYSTEMNNFVNSETNRSLVGERYVRLARFLAQAGKYDLAKQMAEKGLKMEQEELGKRDEQMAEFLYLMAYVADEHMKLEEYMYRSQLPRMKYIIENFEQSAELRKALPGVYHKKLLGLTKNRLSFYYSGYQLRGGDEWLSKEDAQKKAEEAVDEAIQIFKELDDTPHLADATITKGVSFGRACTSQIKSYKEAEEMIYRVIGRLHPSLDRLYLNEGIYYEETGDYYKAYDYFKKWFENCRDLYGIEHPRSGRTISTLREPMYRRIAQERGEVVPELPTNGPNPNPPEPAESPVYI